MNEIIVVANVSKRFAGLTAVDDLSFGVKEGEAVALWGANGAGKTTALRCLLGLLPFEGHISICDQNVQEKGKAARRLIGFVPQELSFHDDMSVAETLTFYAQLKKIPAGHDFAPLLNRLEVTPHTDKRVRDLSGGLKQRLALVLALLADPPVLVLDEPSSNLDISARDDFLALLQQLKAGGKTLVFASHRLEEVTALADRVLLLEAGRLVIDAPPPELEMRLGWASTLHLYLPQGAIEPARQQLTSMGLAVSQNGRGVRVQVKPGQKSNVLRQLHEAGLEIEDFTLE